MTGIKAEQRTELIRRAVEALPRAYAPYSNYPVGAAVLAGSGAMYSGVNIENSAYPSGVCAERAAVFSAVSQGEREILAVVVASRNGGMPCGSCRQVISEFGPDARVIVVDGEEKIVREAGLRELLPHAFGPADLSTGR